jgi:hypothetical protein
MVWGGEGSSIEGNNQGGGGALRNSQMRPIFGQSRHHSVNKDRPMTSAEGGGIYHNNSMNIQDEETRLKSGGYNERGARGGRLSGGSESGFTPTNSHGKQSNSTRPHALKSQMSSSHQDIVSCDGYKRATTSHLGAQRGPLVRILPGGKKYHSRNTNESDYFEEHQLLTTLGFTGGRTTADAG